MKRVHPTDRFSTLLRRAQWRAAVFALLFASALLTVTGLYMLHDYEMRSMNMVASSLAFAGEPALRFGDRAAMLELIQPLAETARLSEVRVMDRFGAPWIEYRRPDSDATDRWARRLQRWLTAGPAEASIGDASAPIGRIDLRPDGQAVLHYVEWSLVSVFLCMLATVGVVTVYSRRLTAAIVTPLAALAKLTHEVRTSRLFERRAGHSSVREIDALAGDFNSLLSEMQSQQSVLDKHYAELQNSNVSLRKASLYDSLTSLPNRAYLAEHLDAAITSCKAKGTQLALLFIDTDRFKEVNDHYGHAVGDAVLVDLSQRLCASVRESDFVARLGGDEFIIVLTPLDDMKEIDRVTDRILGRLDEPLNYPGGVTYTTSVTIGVSLFPDHGETSDSLIKAADVAMYRAKATSRGSVATFIPTANGMGSSSQSTER